MWIFIEIKETIMPTPSLFWSFAYFRGFDKKSCNSSRYGNSSDATNEYATPDCPARAHRPTRCINNLGFAGKLKFITLSSEGISIPEKLIMTYIEIFN